jgi:hypothetical protein
VAAAADKVVEVEGVVEKVVLVAEEEMVTVKILAGSRRHQENHLEVDATTTPEVGGVPSRCYNSQTGSPSLHTT